MDTSLFSVSVNCAADSVGEKFFQVETWQCSNLRHGNLLFQPFGFSVSVSQDLRARNSCSKDDSFFKTLNPISSNALTLIGRPAGALPCPPPPPPPHSKVAQNFKTVQAITA